MQLINDATAAAVEPGTVIHLVSGPNTGQAWRFEKITEHPTDGHRVHVTRVHPRIGRIHREYHPQLFGCSVVIDVQWYADKQRLLRAVRHTAATWLSAFAAAVVAWLVHEYGNAEWGGVLALFGVHAEG